jgi:tyrosyl-tRNA synthetase
MAFPSVDEQLAILLRGAAQIETREELKRKLERSFATGKPLRVKYGIDPTGFDVHLGHTVPLRKLRQFQDLGHTAVLIIGTATAQVGDPSGRDASRAGLTPEQIEKNATTYLTQIAKVVDVTKAEVRPNAAWFSKWGFAEMLHLLGQTTIQQILAREDFSNRVKSGTPIYLHECLYPLMQGWDSVEIEADVELGGTEQLFNLMVGRDLQKGRGQAPQVPFTMPILRGLDGEKKMGKSLGNFIGVGEPASTQFAKAMSITDNLMEEWFQLLTNRSSDEIRRFTNNYLDTGDIPFHPMEAKKILASDIVEWFHGPELAKSARADWEKQFSERKDPDVIDEVTIPAADLVDGAMTAQKLVFAAGLTKSGGEARKKIEEGAFNYGPEKTKPAEWKTPVPVSDGLVLRLGRRIVRVKLG